MTSGLFYGFPLEWPLPFGDHIVFYDLMVSIVDVFVNALWRK